ncbi:MAG: ABC transporter ATP-binding protein [Myxococcales bacterium]|nr:ABC transporter ATP-binding protein [Myxococcales bacterium]
MRLDRIEVRRVSKVFDRQRAIFDVDAEIRSGDVLGLLGPNGAGKTTLLGLLSSLSRPSHGSVRWWSRGTALDVRSVRSQLAWVAHETFTYDELSGLENVELVARLHGDPTPRRSAEAWLDRVQLGFARDRLARTYSRGMRQRLALARALVGRPEALLLDEPFSGLDGPSIQLVYEVIREAKARGAAMVLVTHDLAQAADLCDRFLLLRAGQVKERVETTLPVADLRSLLAKVSEERPS